MGGGSGPTCVLLGANLLVIADRAKGLAGGCKLSAYLPNGKGFRANVLPGYACVNTPSSPRNPGFGGKKPNPQLVRLYCQQAELMKPASALIMMAARGETIPGE
eukprot:TRINITY_DN10441_c0_g1_i9.p4 TRINITY_DN10441_c0_g1~~TRINITY_DN10441_c0_g1_i9.p4  ORF type:complete len:104 (-),score=6.95 TRINITY_DN10441_c0_g1_i9:967-1278(-)